MASRTINTVTKAVDLAASRGWQFIDLLDAEAQAERAMMDRLAAYEESVRAHDEASEQAAKAAEALGVADD